MTYKPPPWFAVFYLNYELLKVTVDVGIYVTANIAPPYIKAVFD